MSKSKKNYDENVYDVNQLLDIHVKVTGIKRGRRSNVDALNKSAIVMICACWEAFIEDVLLEAAKHLSDTLKAPDKVPAPVVSAIVKNVVTPKEEAKAWKALSCGWRSSIVSNATFLAHESGGFGINTPRPGIIKPIFEKAIGIQDITSSWSWQNMLPNDAVEKLDALVTRRGDFAHKARDAKPAHKKECREYLSHIDHLVICTEKAVNKHLEDLTGSSLG